MVRKEFQNFDETLKIASNLLLPVSQRFSELDLVFEVKVQLDAMNAIVLYCLKWGNFLAYGTVSCGKVITSVQRA